ncbi:UrcA family protein [Sphingomonas crusticola]|uniref:UrcA family protein n=1 Tax=Sphingomonas crusticola TaxID=1697973 RepID=UPI000E2760CF|nr:UrcA family protein [Sphingomonas crusticola]
MIRLSPFALAGALLATSVTILAVTPTQAASRHVRYGDLDLTSPAGRAAVEARLHTAAGAVCWSDYNTLSLIAACRRATMSQARADLNRAVRGSLIQVAAR